MNLTDPFPNVKKKDIKNKRGEVVARVDYVGWSEVAQRLDEAAPGWSFAIVQLGDDWCWGRLTLDGRTFENVGYAENAEAEWKKEALKDAVSDALKRCAAMAGVARYLYGDTLPASRNGTATVRIGREEVPTERPRPAIVPSTPSGTVAAPTDLDDREWDALLGGATTPVAVASLDECPVHHLPWKTVPAGTSKAGKAYSAFKACQNRDCKERPR